MRHIFLCFCAVLLFSCESDDPETALEQVTEDLEIGAILRTIAINNGEFNINDVNSTFSVLLEENDEKDGGLLDVVEVYTSFVQRGDNGNNTVSSEKFVKTISEDRFARSGGRLLRTTLSVTYQELIDATGIDRNAITCGDQFIVRLNLKLTDGRSFTLANANSYIVAMGTFNSSPFCYTINVVEPLASDLFIGNYLYTSILDGPMGPSFGESGILEIVQGHSSTTRTFRTRHVTSAFYREPFDYEFSITCDESIFSKFQFTTFSNTCSNFTGQHESPILLGPSEANAQINRNDDSVFELWLAEGYGGYNGGCDFNNAPSRILFTKQ